MRCSVLCHTRSAAIGNAQSHRRLQGARARVRRRAARGGGGGGRRRGGLRSCAKGQCGAAGGGRGGGRRAERCTQARAQCHRGRRRCRKPCKPVPYMSEHCPRGAAHGRRGRAAARPRAETSRNRLLYVCPCQDIASWRAAAPAWLTGRVQDPEGGGLPRQPQGGRGLPGARHGSLGGGGGLPAQPAHNGVFL